MRNALRLAFVGAVVVGLATCSQVAPEAPAVQTQAVSGTTRTLQYAGTSTFQSGTVGTTYGLQLPEALPMTVEHDVAKSAKTIDTGTPAQPGRGGHIVNRIPPKAQVPFTPPHASSGASSGTGTTTLGAQATGAAPFSFQGLDHFDQRYADNGNQFSTEPPDQGLCTGNGYVMEAVNDVVRVFTSNGTPVQGVVSLNKFFGYSSAIGRTTGAYGPFLTDPSCMYDAASTSWFLDVLTLDVDPATGDFTGTNHIDIAVMKGGNPAQGKWSIYKLDVTRDGSSAYNLGDYPHIGANADGFYVTTDSFPFFGSGYNGAWVYAISKGALTTGHKKVPYEAMPLIDPQGTVGYSVWPATSLAGAYPTQANGMEYFLSSDTVFTSSASDIVVWALTNTDSLASKSGPDVSYATTHVGVTPYGDPSATVPQKAGSVPLANLQADSANSPFGPPYKKQPEGAIATNDSGMKQVMYVNGHLWGALTTTVSGGKNPNDVSAGAAWFELKPSAKPGSVSASLVNQGVVAPDGANFIFPALAVNAGGQGVIAGTLVGPNNYPSAAYVPLNHGTTGGLVVAHAGNGPQDGFTEYTIGGDTPRWGDYGAAVVDANSNFWIASEDIHQTCSYAQFLADTTCGKTRSILANWSTQITQLKP